MGVTDDTALVQESVGSSGGYVTIALDVRDGAERWRLSTVRGLGVAAGPIAGNGVAVLDTDVEGAPFGIGVDVGTGVERWRIEPGESVIGHTDDIVVVSASPGSFSAPPSGPPGGLRGIDRATGEQRWVNDDVVFSDQSGVGVGRGAAAIADTTIAVPTGATLTAVDTITGAVLWTAPQLNHPNAADGVIVGMEPQQSGNGNGSVGAVDVTTGQTLWSAPGVESYGGLLAVGDGVVVVMSDTREFLVAYDLPTGSERWRVENRPYAEPQLVSGNTLVTLWEGELGAYSTTDGSRIWGLTEPLRSPLMQSVGTDGTSIVVSVNSLPFGD